METLLTYFIKVSVLVTLFYLSYHFLLKRETFFSKNRLFLLLGLATSVVLPMMTITKTVWIEPIQPVVFEEPFILPDFSDDFVINTVSETPKTEINWIFIVAGFYVLGMLFFLVKFILSSLSLYKILHKNPIQKQNGFRFIDSKNVKTPFSFFNYIAFDSSDFSEEELQNIITHEKVHSTEKHSFDVILSEIFSVVFWLNPFVWLYKKAIQQNLEFIADEKAVKTSENKVNYQKTLLKITLKPQELALANPFFQPLIKKRIIMLNKNQSKNRNLLKYALILPVLVVFVMQFQTKVVAQEKAIVVYQEKNITEEQQYKLPTSVDWEYAKDVLILQDTTVWVKDFANSYEKPDEWVKDFEKGYNSTDSEKIIIKGGSWKDVKEHLDPNKKPLHILNGKEIPQKDILTLTFDGGVKFTKYEGKEAVEKFGEKGKDGVIVIEGNVIDSKLNNDKELIRFLRTVKDYKLIDIYNRWGNLVYTLKPNEKLDEQKLNAFEDGTYFYTFEKSSGEKVSGYLYKGENNQQIQKQEEREQKLREREIHVKEAERKATLYEERREREKQAQEKSGLSKEEIKARSEKLKQKNEERQQKIEERKKIVEERRKEVGQILDEREQKIDERKKIIEERRKEKDEYNKSEVEQIKKMMQSDVNFSYKIDKNTTDAKIKECIEIFKHQEIDMKVSNIKRNKNGEIYKIKISLSESSGTKNNKKESKTESTFERNSNEAIPEIFIGRRNSTLSISGVSR